MSDTHIDAHGRPEPAFATDEIGTLTGFLEFQRATLEWKTRGLTDDHLHATMAPTTMTLAGLLMHLAFVEDFWFAITVARQAPAEPFASANWDADPDFDWHIAASLTGDQLRTHWAEAVDRSRAIVASALNASALDADAPDPLGQTYTAWGGAEHPSLRWIITHMIEEYARHNGHADLLREAIDGEVGE